MSYSKPELLDLVLQVLRDTGATPLLLDSRHPFIISIERVGSPPCEFRVFIWNCTHGGAGRARDEFRVQATTPPYKDQDRQTLMLGWHLETGTLAAWDINAHDGQASISPSAQVKFATLLRARDHGFAAQVKDNETVFAFRPDFFIDYAFGARDFHGLGTGHEEIQWLNNLGGLTDHEIDEIRDPKRSKVIRMVVSNYRNSRFRGDVLDAYGHACAFCGLQMSLIDAAHILPVSVENSTDDIDNGIALCKLHHYAYDSGLLSFNERHEIQVSKIRQMHLSHLGKLNGFPAFRKGLSTHISLPTHGWQYPNPKLITLSRKVREWLP